MAYANSPDGGMPRLTSAKLVVAGGPGVGKTTMLGAVSEIPPVSTEAWLTQDGESADDPPGTKTKTTVAMDFGRITLGHDLVLYLFGTPGQPRFWRLWDDLCRGASGAVVLVDTCELGKSFAAVNYFENDSDIPFVVAVNLFEGGQRHQLGDVRGALRLNPDIPLVSCDARDRASALQTLVTALEHTMARAAAPAVPLSQEDSTVP